MQLLLSRLDLCPCQLNSLVTILVGVNLKFCKFLGICYLCCTEPIDEDADQPSANEDIVAQLVSMGFNQIHCQKAAIKTSNVGVEEAMNWLLSHMDDPGFYCCFSLCKTNIFSQSYCCFPLLTF